MTSPRKLFQGFLAGISRRVSGRRRARRRPLALESLERRSLLATNLGAIAGTVFLDKTDNGWTADDVGRANVGVSLYLDSNASNTLDSGDTPVGSDTTDATGGYRFDNLSAGTYLVSQAPVVGLTHHAGQSVQTVVISATEAQGTAGRVIDSFSQTTQNLQAAVGADAPLPQYAANTVAAPEAIGGRRGFYLELTGGTGGAADLYANYLQPDVLRFEGDSSVIAKRVVSWDGSTVGTTPQTTGSADPTGSNPTGLNHQDLTEANQNVGLRLLAGADHDSVTATIHVYTDATHVSTYVVPLPNTGDGSPSSTPLDVPFSDFTAVGANGGAAFNDVGAVYFGLSPGAAVNARMRLLGTVRPSLKTANLANLLDADLAVTKTDGVANYVPGGTTTYTVVVTNNGPADVAGATVTDTFDAALGTPTWTATGTTGTVFTPSGSGSLSQTVSIPAGGAITYTITAAKIDPAKTNDLINVATVQAPSDVLESNLQNNSATDTDVPRLVSDLSITKTDGTTTYTPGQGLTYTIVVSNVGPTNVQGATVTDTFDAALGAPTWTATGTTGTVFTASGSGNLSQTVSLPAGGSITYTVAVSQVSVAKTGDLSNTATVQAPNGTTDPTPANNTATDVDTPRPVADLAITKTDGTTTYTPGQGLAYTIVVSNVGPSNVTGATVTDTFDAALGTPTWTATGTTGAVFTASGSGNLSQTVSIPVGGSITYAVTVSQVSVAKIGDLSNTATVQTPNGTTDPTPANNTATDVDTPRPVADLAITKTDGTTTYTPGQGLAYTIVVSNVGPSNVTGATVTDTFDAALGTPTWTATGTTGTVFTASGSGNLSQTVSIPVGGSITYAVTVSQVSVAKTGNLSNTATVQPPNGTTDPTPANNTATDVDTPRPVADLAITKTDGTTTYTPGQGLTYTIVVSNVGPSNVTGATVTDTFDAALGTPTWTATGTTGTVFTASGSGNLSQTVTIPVGGSITYTVAVAKVNAARTGDLVNTAAVAPPTGTTDPTPANNTATDTDTARLVCDLVITKTDGQSTYTPGQGLTYTVVVSNVGPSNVTGATVADTFDTALSTPTWTATGTTGTTFAASGSGNLAQTVSIPTGGSITYTATVAKVDPARRGDLVNTATVTAPTAVTDPTPANNTASDTDTASPQVDLAISKTAAPTPAKAGQSLTYTLLVTNNGPSQATGAKITDVLPNNVTYVSATATRGTVAQASGTVTIDVGDFAVGESITVTVVTTVAANAQGSITNQASVTANEGEANTANNQAVNTTAVDAALSSLAGVVYLDNNRNGARDTGDGVLSGVLITLTGTDGQGNAVNKTATTDASGAFSFAQLAAGTYSLTETNPANYQDGKDTVGTVAANTATKNKFADIPLASGVAATSYLFGEMPTYFSKRAFLGSSHQ